MTSRFVYFYSDHLKTMPSSFDSICTFSSQAEETFKGIYDEMKEEIDAHGEEWADHIEAIVDEYVYNLDNRQIMQIIYHYGTDDIESECVTATRGQFLTLRQMAHACLHNTYMNEREQ